MNQHTLPARWLLALSLGLAYSMASADSASDRAERTRIERERNAAEQVYAAKDRECRTRFEVTSCVDAAQGERRESLKRLRVQQELLDEAARRERAAKRLESIRQKESGADAKQREAMARLQQRQMSSAMPASDAASSAVRPTSKMPSTRLPREHAAPVQTTPASAAERASAYADRQREIEAHRRDVAKRNAERNAKGKKSTPLEVPASIPGAKQVPNEAVAGAAASASASPRTPRTPRPLSSPAPTVSK